MSMKFCKDMRMSTVEITQNIPLAPYTTLGVGGRAEYFCEVTTLAELCDVFSWAKTESHPITILAGGSNVLVRDGGIRGLVIRPQLLGSTYTGEGEEVFVTVGAGVLLDACIQELVAKKIWGLENLSGIPGSVGAVPIQNVGAYGVEVKDTIVSVEVFDTETQTVRMLQNTECQFAYRDSLFKHKEGKRYVVTAVKFKLSTVPFPQCTYTDLKIYFDALSNPSIEAIRIAVLEIRSRKFPDVTRIGTAGSFFKNPIVTRKKIEELHKKYPALPAYTQGINQVKVSLGWILDHVCHVRGYTENGIGLYERQALVLICEKNVSAQAIEDFSQNIIDRVFQETGILIEREVTVLGNTI